MDFREYFEKEDQLLPTKKGVTLTVDMWKKLMSISSEIDQCIEDMQSDIPPRISPESGAVITVAS